MGHQTLLRSILICGSLRTWAHRTQKGERRRNVDFDLELFGRQRRAMERERRGLLGERFVYEQEVERLTRLGKKKLAQEVELISCTFGDRGFDIQVL
jgi:hypothetical protein